MKPKSPEAPKTLWVLLMRDNATGKPETEDLHKKMTVRAAKEYAKTQEMTYVGILKVSFDDSPMGKVFRAMWYLSADDRDFFNVWLTGFMTSIIQMFEADAVRTDRAKRSSRKKA